ncbi:MAG: response regulator [Bacillota bacterium]
MPSILVVDDSNTVRLTLQAVLTQAGYTVEEARDGEEAIQKIKALPKFNAVITDLNMPRMDGISLIKEVRGLPAYRFTPILMLTTEGAVAKKEEGKKAGATGWIVKPFTPDQLLAVLKKVQV